MDLKRCSNFYKTIFWGGHTVTCNYGPSGNDNILKRQRAIFSLFCFFLLFSGGFLYDFLLNFFLAGFLDFLVGRNCYIGEIHLTDQIAGSGYRLDISGH